MSASVTFASPGIGWATNTSPHHVQCVGSSAFHSAQKLHRAGTVLWKRQGFTLTALPSTLAALPLAAHRGRSG
jgi:hypothetical protein